MIVIVNCFIFIQTYKKKMSYGIIDVIITKVIPKTNAKTDKIIFWKILFLENLFYFKNLIYSILTNFKVNMNNIFKY